MKLKLLDGKEIVVENKSGKEIAASISESLSKECIAYKLNGKLYDLYSIVASFRDDRITYYKNKSNEGGKSLVNQWNKCIEYAKGTYTIMASDDDLYDSKFLENVDVLVDKYPHVNVLRGRVVRIDKKTKR